MAKDRILGSSAKIELFQANGSVLTLEVDSFTKTQTHGQKQFQPLGEVGKHTQIIYVGWELDFKVGKTDSTASDFFDALDQALLNGQAAPRVRVVETVQHYDGNDETGIFPDTALTGYKADDAQADDEIKEEFKGYAQKRIKG